MNESDSSHRQHKNHLSGSATQGQLLSWSFYDFANTAFATVIQTFIFAAYFTRRVAPDETAGAALWGLAIGGAGILIALGGPLIGAAADQGGRRKPWLLLFTVLCTFCIALMWFVTPSADSVWRALILIAAATVCAEYAMIFYNAMLPSLVGPQRMGRWSGWGWSLGYVGGLLCLILALLFVVSADYIAWLDKKSFQHIRITFVIAAGWYMLFGLPLFLFTPDAGATGKPFLRCLRDGALQLKQTLASLFRHRRILYFLIARMIYIDGLATIFAYGGVYAAGTFDMSEQQVLLFGICLNVTAGAGAAVFGMLDDRIGSKRIILIAISGIIISGTCILTVQQQILFWIFGSILGIFVGPLQASSRTYLARVASPAIHNQMFGLYALSGKATSFAGPLLVGLLTSLTGSQRAGMSVIIALLLAGGALMCKVPRD